MRVVADPEAVSFIAEHGGRLYVYADAGDLKHVKTTRPDDESQEFEEIEANGFLLYVDPLRSRAASASASQTRARSTFGPLGASCTVSS
jgi:hypothetical protein